MGCPTFFVVAVMIYILISAANGRCVKNGPLDLTVIVDTSDAVGSENLEKRLKPAMKSFINYMYPGNEKTLMISRLTIITLNDKPRIHWMHTENIEKKIWYAAINNITFSGGGRATGDALDEIFVVIEKHLRKNVSRVAILFAAGSQTSGLRSVVWVADDLKMSGVKLYVVGFGSYANSTEFHQITGEHNFGINVSNNDSLSNVMLTLSNMVCPQTSKVTTDNLLANH
jgi:predicted nucleotidyltransferase